MDNGQWTEIMSHPFRADSNIADPTDQSEKTIDRITNSRAIPSVKAATPIKNFRAFSCGSWLKKKWQSGFG